MTYRRRGSHDPPPGFMLSVSGSRVVEQGKWLVVIVAVNEEGEFTVKLIHGGFTRHDLEDMARSLEYRFPFGFLYKPHGKHLNMGFMVVNNASIQLMLEDLTARNNAEANVYLVLPDPQLAVEWEEDAEAIKMQEPQQSSKVEKCKIEELPEGCTVVADVVVNPQGMSISSSDDSIEVASNEVDSIEVDSNEVEEDFDYFNPPEMEDYMAWAEDLSEGEGSDSHQASDLTKEQEPPKESDAHAEPDAPKSPEVVLTGFNEVAEPDAPNSPEVVVTGVNEVAEETPRSKRLRLRRMRKAPSQPQTEPQPQSQPQTQEPTTPPVADAAHDTLPETQPDPNTDFEMDYLSQPLPETQPQTQPQTQTQTEPQTQTQPQTEPQPQSLPQPQTEPQPQRQTTDADFEFIEEEFNPATQGEVEREHVGTSDPNRWWNQASENPVGNDDGNDGLDSGDELHSVHSDDEEGDHTSRLEFNPQTKKDDFKFELNMEFGSIEILRAALKEHFIHTDREYILIHNDRAKFRAKCSAEGCPWVLHAHVQPDGMTFKITTITEGGHQCGMVLENRLIDVNWAQFPPCLALTSGQTRALTLYSLPVSITFLAGQKRKGEGVLMKKIHLQLPQLEKPAELELSCIVLNAENLDTQPQDAREPVPNVPNEAPKNKGGRPPIQNPSAATLRGGREGTNNLQRG
ncbi:hypothetical protein F8388_026459 [Cannabis sativa]|uniref:Transposase MuDR plant domain-containing protein n=1 Tax=Cannabis sativa TaxID=3483 RepID=A0A7J6EJK8_CANSA|nr:hypothetical protein F8388_026459 [Cannabis sativa]